MYDHQASYQWRSRRWRMLADSATSAGAGSGDGCARAEVLQSAGARAGGCSEALPVIVAAHR